MEDHVRHLVGRAGFFIRQPVHRCLDFLQCELPRVLVIGLAEIPEVVVFRDEVTFSKFLDFFFGTQAFLIYLLAT